jgi:protease-4
MDDQSPPPDPTPPSSSPMNPPPPWAGSVPAHMAAPPIISPPPPVRKGCSPVWRVLAIVFLVLLCLVILAHMVTSRSSVVARTSHNLGDRGHNLEEVTLQSTNVDDKIAVITVSGVITGGMVDGSAMNLPDFISEQLKSAEKDSDVKAVILKVNSPGGEVMASDDINTSIREFQERCHKPVVASMGELAASGGYYISVPCQWIVANELTITGSIGVIMDTFNYRQLMDKVGIRPQVYKSGRFKDMLSGSREPDTDKLSDEDRKTREEEDRMVQTFINETYAQFKNIVQTGRDHAVKENSGAGRALAGDWTNYADGRILSGRRAMELGFVDELGNFDVAVKRAEKLANIPGANLIEYHEVFDIQSVFSRFLGKTEAPALKLDLGFAPPQLEAGRPYYILPTAVLH